MKGTSVLWSLVISIAVVIAGVWGYHLIFGKKA